MEYSWYTKSISEVLERQNTNNTGLSFVAAARRLEEYGPNKLREAKPDSRLVIFLRQFQSPLIYTLFAASLLVLLMGEIIDGTIILLVLLFNAIVGSIQEGRAQNTFLALKKFTKTKVVVIRDGKEIVIDDSMVVVGDLVVLHEGDKVPADIRIIHSNTLTVDESSLTGESVPVYKTSETLRSEKLNFSSQKNMAFMGTHVVAGSGKGVVVATALNTMIGRIAEKLVTIKTIDPLKKDVAFLSRVIIGVVTGISLIIFFFGVSSGFSLRQMFTTVVSLAVSVIPEGLPIVLTLVLATGVWRMSKRNVLVKKLAAVESLGQAKVIAIDKTGTITKNEMVVAEAYVDSKTFEVSGNGYEPKGSFYLDQQKIDPAQFGELKLLGRIAAFCANARVMWSEENKEWQVSGDPTDAAMLVLGEKLGLNKDDLEARSTAVAEIPFSYHTKYHAVIRKIHGQPFLMVVGAPETILKLSSLTQTRAEDLESVFVSMSRKGLRVLALAYKPGEGEHFDHGDIKQLIFIGFLGMKDALRPEVLSSLHKAASAGIRVVMITGDHKITAEAIAAEAGILRKGDEILTGADLETLSEEELKEKLEKVSVFARVTPEHKLKIIQGFKARGEIIAMTGDGVNDAPSLVAADLGVGMGKIGTEVAKEASDIILLDDNFGSIVGAVEEGRSIYKTIKKVILYLFSTSIGEMLTIVGALALGYPLPLLASQIIWLNFVTDGFLDVALAMEPKEPGLLMKSFKQYRYLVDPPMARRMLVMAPPMAIGTLWLFQSYLGGDLTHAWTISLTTLAVFQWFNAWNCRSDRESLFRMKFFGNKFLVGATAIIITLQLLAVYHPFLQKFLHTTALSLSEWLIIIPVAFSVVVVEELRKLFYRKFNTQ